MLSILSTLKPGFHAGKLQYTWVHQDPCRKNIKKTLKLLWSLISQLYFFLKAGFSFFNFKSVSPKAKPNYYTQNLSIPPLTQTFSSHAINSGFSKIIPIFFLNFLSLLWQTLFPLSKISSHFPLLEHSYLFFKAQCLHDDTVYSEMVHPSQPPSNGKASSIETGKVKTTFSRLLESVMAEEISHMCSKCGSQKGDRIYFCCCLHWQIRSGWSFLGETSSSWHV